jgi:hypothetical protein
LSTGGGKTRLRGVDPHLHRLFKNPSLQLHHRVADLHLRPVDHVPIRRIVHRVGNLTKSPPGFLQHLGYELILVHRQKPIHGMLLIRLPAGKTPLYPPPEFLGTPAPPIDVPQDGFVYADGIYYFLGMDAHADYKVHFEIMGKDQTHPRILRSNLPYDEWGLGNLAETRSLGLVSFGKRFGVNRGSGPLYQVRFLKPVPETQPGQPSSHQN